MRWDKLRKNTKKETITENGSSWPVAKIFVNQADRRPLVEELCSRLSFAWAKEPHLLCDAIYYYIYIDFVWLGLSSEGRSGHLKVLLFLANTISVIIIVSSQKRQSTELVSDSTVCQLLSRKSIDSLVKVPLTAITELYLVKSGCSSASLHHIQWKATSQPAHDRKYLTQTNSLRHMY